MFWFGAFCIVIFYYELLNCFYIAKSLRGCLFGGKGNGWLSLSFFKLRANKIFMQINKELLEGW